MKAILISAAVLASLTGSALAQTTVVTQPAAAGEYYVVRDPTTRRCTIVDQKPAGTTTTVVDNGIFKTRTEAETGMKTIKVCTDN